MAGNTIFEVKFDGGTTGAAVNIRLLPIGTHHWENVLLSPHNKDEKYLVDGIYDIQWMFTGPDADAGITITITDTDTGKPVRPPIVDHIPAGKTAWTDVSRFMIPGA